MDSKGVTSSLQKPNVASSVQQRGYQRTLISSADHVLVEHMLYTHDPYGGHQEVDFKTLLPLIEDIFSRGTTTTDTLRITLYSWPYKELSYTIERMANELAYWSLCPTKTHQTTVAIGNMLANYEWDAKWMVTTAAFALLLSAQKNSTDNLEKSLEAAPVLKPSFEFFDPLSDGLIRTILEMTRCIIKFKQLLSKYITPKVPTLSSAIVRMPDVVYWTVRSVVALTAQITRFIGGMAYDECSLSTTEAWELSILPHKLSTVLEHLKTQLKICDQYFEEKRGVESYEAFVDVFKMIHNDSIKVLKILINPTDELQPIFDCSTMNMVNLEVLKRKNLLLLISGLDVTQDELSILKNIYNESRLHATRPKYPYEIVWIPIVDQLDGAKQMHFEQLRALMTWYTVCHPSIIGKTSIKFIKKEWHFKNKPILVNLDPQGRVVSPNAIYMMWIWGNNAFPFTSLKEEALWRQEAWRLELLVDGIDQTILNWIKEGKYIFMYGSEDIEWIRKFTKEARTVALAVRIPLEMVYVGKATKREQVRQVISTILQEKLSYCWQDRDRLWFFWSRLESMMFSKIQVGINDEEQDLVIQVKRLLSFEREGTWAVLSKASSVLVNGHGNTVLRALLEYETWKENVTVQGFEIAYPNYVALLHGKSHPGCRFDFSHFDGRIPNSMKCPECHQYMTKFSTFLCCHNEGSVYLSH